MAGKKKKKPAANPARGFATTSQPSKSKEPAQVEDEASSEQQDNPATEDASPSTTLRQNNADQPKLIAEMTPAELELHLEDAELQNFVEQYAIKVKAEATRQSVKLKKEHRQLREQADLVTVNGLDESLIDHVLLSPAQATTRSPKGSSVTSASDDDSNELLRRLWLLQEVMKHLNIKPIDEALAAVLHTWHTRSVHSSQDSVWGLDEALIWYTGSRSASEILPYDSDRKSELESTSYPESLETLSDSLEKLEPQNEAPVESEERARDSIDTAHQSEDEMIPSDNDDDPASLVDHWLRLKTRILEKEQKTRATGHGEPQSSSRRLTDRIKSIERDILFDVDSAHRRWQIISRDLEIESGKALKRAVPNVATDEYKVALPQSSETNDTDVDTMLGGIFDGEGVDAQTSPETGNKDTSVHHDFGTWSGSNPQRLLEEACTGHIVRRGLRSHQLETTPYSSRAQLQLFFTYPMEINVTSLECIPSGIKCEQARNTLLLKMVGTTTKTPLQSDAYLATIALFLLISIGVINTKVAVRLPRVWKELLADLNRLRDELVVREDIHNLKHLRAIIRTSQLPSKTGREITTDTEGTREPNHRIQNFRMTSRDAPAQAEAKWVERATSAIFASMQPARQNLPIYAFKSEILHAFHANPILIVCADTGAGKSTQIPSYILEDQLGNGRDYRIMVTQPRRISAISIARRVSAELGEDDNALGTPRSLIGYAIRMESKISHATRITFATTGVLLRMLQESANLDHLNCLVLDEVHERTMDLDLLFIALRRLRKRRSDLKIVLMSATVDATKFSLYFDNAPILDIPGRTYPVKVGFLEDAVEATLDVADGGQTIENIEDDELTEHGIETETFDDTLSVLEKYSATTRRILTQYDHTRLDYNLITRLTVAIATKPEFAEFSKAILIFVPGISEIRRLHNLISTSRCFAKGWVLHMLHSSFSTQDLEKAFRIPPAGSRKIVIATNIAETGITIPDVTAVIDTCKEKIMRFDERRQISRLTEGYIARASARQRKGRAARVQNGLCFHLVTRHHFETRLQDQPVPEMLRLSLQDPILRVKIWDLGPAEEVLLEALDPPSMKNIRRALAKLQDVGALDPSERLTALGRNLAKLPLDVAMGKMAILGVFLQCLDAIVTIIASFSTKSIFVADNSSKVPPELPFSRGDSDLLTVYNAYSGWKTACAAGVAQQFSQKYHLSQFQLRQLEEQKIQLFNYLVDAGLMKLDQEEQQALQRARNSRSGQQGFEVPERYNRLSSDTVINAVSAMAFYPKLLKKEGHAYRNIYSNQQMYIAPTSVNRITGKSPEWLCYLEATQTKSGRLNASHSSKVTQAMLVLLLGQAEFKQFAGVIDVDHGRARLSLRNAREFLALQHLRSQFQRVMRDFLLRPEITLPVSDQAWLDMIVVVLNGTSRTGVQLSNQPLQPQ